MKLFGTNRQRRDTEEHKTVYSDNTNSSVNTGPASVFSSIRITDETERSDADVGFDPYGFGDETEEDFKEALDNIVDNVVDNILDDVKGVSGGRSDASSEAENETKLAEAKSVKTKKGARKAVDPVKEQMLLKSVLLADKRTEAERKQDAEREAMMALARERQAEEKLEAEMREVLAPRELSWIDDEHFRLMCGSGRDERFSCLGFRAMFRAFDLCKAGDLMEAKMSSTVKGAKRYQNFILDQYRSFILSHKVELSARLRKPRELSATSGQMDFRRIRLIAPEPLLNQAVRRHAEIFGQSLRDNLPMRLATVLYSNMHEEVVE